MSISSGVLGKGQAETQEGRTFEGAAFSKTLLKLADQRCRRTRRNPSSLERRRRQARRLVRFSFMAMGHTVGGQAVSSGKSSSYSRVAMSTSIATLMTTTKFDPS